MLSLILGTIFSAGFGVVMRHAQGANRNLWAVGVTNYVVATLFQLVRHWTGPGGTVTWATAVLGMAAGALYGLNFWFFFRLMGCRGLSITNAMGRLSVLIPVLCSVLIWGERLDAIQGVGVALAVVALPLLTLKPSALDAKVDRAAWFFAPGIFLGTGLSAVLVDAHRQYAPDASGAAFLAFLFASAGCVAIVGWWRAGHRWAHTDLPHGAALGLTNALANAGLVAALDHLPGVIVFPVYSAGGLAIVVLTAWLLWREKLGGIELTGMGSTLLAVVLMNLG